jgi:hypothetical protein
MLRSPAASSSPLRRLVRRTAASALVVPLALVAGCGTDDDGAAAAPTVSATTAAPGEPTQPSEPLVEPTPDDAQVIAVTVAGGQVSGAEPRTAVEVGTRVRLTVTSDVADELHVHGYDLTEAVPAGQAVNLEFVADRPGIFEVEMHDTRTVLTRLQVQ